jgi:hypothetical protein
MRVTACGVRDNSDQDDDRLSFTVEVGYGFFES